MKNIIILDKIGAKFMDKYKFLQKIGISLNKIRKAKEISLYDVAKLTKINYSHLKNIEAGKVDINLKTLVKICQSIDIKFKEFCDIANI